MIILQPVHKFDKNAILPRALALTAPYATYACRLCLGEETDHVEYRDEEANGLFAICLACGLCSLVLDVPEQTEEQR